MEASGLKAQSVSEFANICTGLPVVTLKNWMRRHKEAVFKHVLEPIQKRDMSVEEAYDRYLKSRVAPISLDKEAMTWVYTRRSGTRSAALIKAPRIALLPFFTKYIYLEAHIHVGIESQPKPDPKHKGSPSAED